jgi:hypothetical protein
MWFYLVPWLECRDFALKHVTSKPPQASLAVQKFTTIMQFQFMFWWPWIPILACNKANLMHYLSTVYSVTIPLHVSGLLVAYHQEVTMCICNNWYVLYILNDCQPTDVQHTHPQYSFNCSSIEHLSEDTRNAPWRWQYNAETCTSYHI